MKTKLKFKKLKIKNFTFGDLTIDAQMIGSGSPKIAVLNGLHGLEKTGAYLMPLLVNKIKTINGTLALIPFANPTSFLANTRRTPEDGQDLNRIFPGQPTGTLSFRLAAVLFDFLKNFDVVIDIHTFPKMQMPLVAVYFADVKAELKARLLKVIRVFQPDYIWKLDTRSGERNKGGSLIEALGKIDKLAFSLEVPDVEFISPEQEQRVIVGVQKVFDFLNGRLKRQEDIEIPIIFRKAIISPINGFLVPKVGVNEIVKKGQILGTITSPTSFKEKTVRSTLNGPVVFILNKTFVNLGDRVVLIGQNVPA